MALTVYYLTKSRDSRPVLNDVYGVLYTTDPALAPSDTAAERAALASAACNAALGLPPTDGNTSFPDDYFDNELELGAAAGGGMSTDDDLVIVSKFGDTQAIT